MRAVVQRVKEARVRVEGGVVGEIGTGLCVLLGVEKGDGEGDIEYIANKLTGLRVFEDDSGKMNLGLLEAAGAAQGRTDGRGPQALVVSQFTLLGDARKGRRPSFANAEDPDRAVEVLNLLVSRLESAGVEVSQGVFGAHMELELVNDGPVTILMDSRKTF